MKLLCTLLGFIFYNDLMALNNEPGSCNTNEPYASEFFELISTRQETASVVAGYVYTTQWPALTAAERLSLFEEWYALASVAGADQVPIPREFEIYELLVRDAEKPEYPNISNYWDWSSAAEVNINMIHLEQLKDLGFLENAIYHADMILTTRVQKVVETTGQMEHTWVSSGEKDAWGNEVERMPFLSGGFNCSAIGSVAGWILKHPEIYNQTAPSDAAIPLTGFGTTYYERAEFYLQQLLKVYDAWEREGFWYEFDTANQCGSWIQNFETYRDTLNCYKAAYPNGFDVSEFLNIVPYAMGSKPERQLFKAWNRQWHMNWGYMVTADALMLLDSVIYVGFYDRAIEVSSKVLNFWRGLRVEVTEPAPIGNKYLWGYKPVDRVPAQRTEDNVHLWMDKRALESHRHHGLFTDQELATITNSFTHGRYDFFNFLPYKSMGKDYFYDGEGNPYDPGKTHRNSDADGPEAGNWVGEYATDEQFQLFAAKCLEVTSERLRLLNKDINTFSLAGDNAYTSLGMLFELHEAKIARQFLHKPDDPSNAPPVIDPVNYFRVSPQAEIGDSITTITASDTDSHQNLYYWIVGGNDDYKFKIDMYSGEITLREPLDAIQKNYPLIIEVADDGAPFKSSTEKISFTVSVYTGINERISKPILIYPNPLTDILNIELSGESRAEVTIVTFNGITIAKKEFNNSDKLNFNTRGWRKGLYFVTIIDHIKGTKVVEKVQLL